MRRIISLCKGLCVSLLILFMLMIDKEIVGENINIIEQTKSISLNEEEQTIEPDDISDYQPPKYDETISAYIVNDIFGVYEDILNNPVLTKEEIIEKSIWLGDSRTVGMKEHVGQSDYIAKGAMSYNWFKSDAIPMLKEKLNEDPNRFVIICFGVNDCANFVVGGRTNNSEKYAEDVNELIKCYPKTKFYFVSVNPVNGDYHTKYRDSGLILEEELNSEIEKFNSVIINNCNAIYIDTYSYMKDNGFHTFDGIHYVSETNHMIFNYVIGKI